MRRSNLVLLAITAMLVLPTWGQTSDPKRSLVVVIVVDQMRQDQLEWYRERYLNAEHGGFLRLSQGGVEHARAFHDHHPTHTATGHSSLASGALPSVHGVVGNRWNRLSTGVADEAGSDPDFPLVGGDNPKADGFSPRDLTAPTLGDTFKRASGGSSKVVSVALKNRTAVLLGGPSADLAVWLDEASGNWATSSYYAPDGQLPPFVSSWNKAHHPSADFAKLWTPELSGSSLPVSLAGDGELAGVAGDYKGLGANFPHRIDGGHAEGVSGDFYTAWAHTPWALGANVDLALEAVDFYQMGTDRQPDLLYLGLASLDKIGHVFGPDSPEAFETLLQIDRALARFLNGLEQRVGLENCLIVLTADHGVTPLVEHLREFRTVARRLPPDEFRRRLVARLSQRWAPSDYTLVVADPHIFLTPTAGKAADKPAMLAALKSEAEATEGVLQALEGSALMEGRHRGTSWEKTIARSYYPGRSGDLILVFQPNTILGFSILGGTNHGSPWTEDSHVPLLMYGWPQGGVVESSTCTPRQLVSTICLRLGFTPPGGCDVDPLPWAKKSR